MMKSPGNPDTPHVSIAALTRALRILEDRWLGAGVGEGSLQSVHRLLAAEVRAAAADVRDVLAEAEIPT